MKGLDLKIKKLENQLKRLKAKKIKKETPKNTILEKCEFKAYTDGSYNKNKNITGFGVVIIKNNSVISEFSGIVPDTTMWQIEGELTAVMEAVKYCEKENIPKIIICFDYTGCEYFATRKWKTKKQFIQSYIDFMNSTKIKILWQKVKGHSGDYFNELADKLAESITK